MTDSEKLQKLRKCLADGTFHHATYRDFGTVWEGLVIYTHENNYQGFAPEIVFGKDDPELRAAEDLVRHTGISVGAHGRG